MNRASPTPAGSISRKPRNAPPVEELHYRGSVFAEPERLRSIPIELLFAVFGFLRVSHRLHVSLVCKRWRTAVLRSVTAFTIIARREQHSAMQEALSLFPELRRLTLRVSTAIAPVPIRLPAALQSISFKRPPLTEFMATYSQESWHFEQPLPLLLQFAFTSASTNVDSALPLLSSSISTLTSLRLELAVPFAASMTNFLLATYLSRLTIFSVKIHEIMATSADSRANTRKAVDAFISRHSTQLTSLFMDWPDHWQQTPTDCFSADFPALRSLALPALPTAHMGALYKLREHCPQLREACVAADLFGPLCVPHSDIPQWLYTTITRLSCRRYFPHYRMFDLPALRKLEHVTLTDGNRVELRDLLYLPLAKVVTRISLRVTNAYLEELFDLMTMGLTNLVHLAIYLDFNMSRDVLLQLGNLAWPQLPHLRTLHITHDGHTPAGIIAYLGCISRGSPLLSKAVIECPSLTAQFVETLGKVLHERRSVEFVYFVVNRRSAVEEIRAAIAEAQQKQTVHYAIRV